jgi:hypothetical protein
MIQGLQDFSNKDKMCLMKWKKPIRSKKKNKKRNFWKIFWQVLKKVYKIMIIIICHNQTPLLKSKAHQRLLLWSNLRNKGASPPQEMRKIRQININIIIFKKIILKISKNVPFHNKMIYMFLNLLVINLQALIKELFPYRT